MSQVIGFLNKIHGFLSGLNIPDYVFLALFVIIFIWLIITNKKVNRAIGTPFRVMDKQFKKRLEDVDKKKAEAEELVEKEIQKVNKLQQKLEAQVEEEIQALRELRVEKEIQMKKEVEPEKVEAEKEAQKEAEAKEEKVRVQPAQAAEEVRVEKAPPVAEVQAEKRVEPDKEVEKVGIEEKKVESKPEEELKESVEKLPKKDMTTKFSSEQIYILSAIGDEPDKTLQEDALFKIYQLAFPDMKKEDFDHQIKKLEKLGFIQLERPSGYKVWVKITDQGLELYRASVEK